MKLTPFILTATMFATIPAFAQEGKADAAPATDKAASPADKAWAELETMMKGPKKRPTSAEEAKTIYKEYLAELDVKAAAFIKDNPSDARRWKLAANELQSAGMRNFAGVPKDKEATKKVISDILAAPDADPESKGLASFSQAMDAQSNLNEFKKLAEAHKSAYPKYKRNAMLDSEIKRLEAEQKFKATPLDIKFAAVDGTNVDLAKMRGKVVLIDFWATWCGPCVAEIPNVVAAYEKLHPKGFEIVGISFDNADDKDKLVNFTKEKKMPWVQQFDGHGWKNEFGQKYGINSIPRMWLVNKKGMLVDTNGRENLVAKVEKLLAE